ncbi:MAG: hypothetical protein BECKG1743E_GA0114224_110772, partial [Candidatus Kentron sp. G]
LLDTFGAQVSSDHERYPADVKCLGFLYLYVGRYPRNNASRNTKLDDKDKQVGIFFDRNRLRRPTGCIQLTIVQKSRFVFCIRLFTVIL